MLNSIQSKPKYVLKLEETKEGKNINISFTYLISIIPERIWNSSLYEFWVLSLYSIFFLLPSSSSSSSLSLLLFSRKLSFEVVIRTFSASSIDCLECDKTIQIIVCVCYILISRNRFLLWSCNFRYPYLGIWWYSRVIWHSKFKDGSRTSLNTALISFY